MSKKPDISDRNINKFPQYNSSLSNFNISDFDSSVKEYCKSMKLNISRVEMRTCKIIVIGNMGVGKSALVQRFVNDSFSNDYKATIGVDFEVEQFQVLNVPFNLNIWDTAGQERFKCIAGGKFLFI